MNNYIYENSRRLLIYKRILIGIWVLGVFFLLLASWHSIWKRIPSSIKLKAGIEQTINLSVPATGELYLEAIAVSGFNGSDNPVTESIHINFARPVTMKASVMNQYTLDVKLFGIIPIKSIHVEVIQDKVLTPAGIPIGIYVKTQGILVVGVGEFESESGQTCAPAKYILQSGDYILEINDEEVNSKKELIEKINHCEGQNIVLKVQRNEETSLIMLQPEQNKIGEYKLGIWVRDNAQGVGTMTFVDENQYFGALGHGINDVDTSTLMSLESGTLYQTQIIGITRGSNGSPGELTGYIEYDDNNILGNITENTMEGIFGYCNEKAMAGIVSEALPIGLKQEIHLGEAQIICSIGGETEYYDIAITKINLDNDNINRGIVLEITDEELLALTGGIVQGMSGSPIVQDGKIIGAVTHVLVQDATRGYGIFIENMLSN